MQGRADKKFCSIKCKNEHHNKAKASNRIITKQIDDILHKNRLILVDLMGERKKKKVDRLLLEAMRFNFNYITGIYRNSQGKLYHYVYDFAWMEFSNQEIMIVRK